MDLTDKDENQVNTCHLKQSNIFSVENLSACEKYVLTIQRRLDKAVANDDRPNIKWYTHLLMKRSRAVKILSVHRVCSVNQGKYTAGIDGMAMPKEKEWREVMKNKLLESIDITSTPNPIRRVYIPKPNGGKRPLGIPTIKDRINQDIIRQTIEPICEYHFLPCSYGFRPKKSTQDAMQDLHNKLGRRTPKRWVVEGDIKGCFDNINHSHIISTLKKWRIGSTITNVIKDMIKADILWGFSNIPSTDGTPQGGIISPILANVALTCLDEMITERYPTRKRDLPIVVRYADDFIIVAKTKQQAKDIRKQVKIFLKEMVGVELSDNKTLITEINSGFDFLGFNFKKYQDKLLITPSKDNIKGVKLKITEVVKKLSGLSIDVIIPRLNPILIGWGNYYRHCSSKRIYTKIDDYVWQKMWQWTKKKHPTGSGKYRRDRYLKEWRFYDRETGLEIVKLRKIPIRRFIKVKKEMRVYELNAIDYWESREYMNAKNSIYGSKTLTRLFSSQGGKCVYCKKPITDSDIKGRTIHKHHLKPRSCDGDWKSGNLRLLHSECHIAIHGLYTRQEMADLADKGIDYIRLMKPKT